MLCVVNQNTNPFFNIASEEYLLKSFDEDIFMLYRNEPSVIIGKHQNAFAEVNYLFVSENKINVIRRLSGGGAVFHDLGNVNFTFITTGKEGNLVNFKRFLAPVVVSLNKLGVPAEPNSRNDIIINGFKVSGNAEHVFKNKTLHHGTLLYSSKLGELRQSLNVRPEQFMDKAVRSVRSSVNNISEYMVDIIPVEEFMRKIQQSIIESFINTEFYEFSDNDLERITQLAEQKYKSWDWNFGYSPKCTIHKSGLIDNITYSCNLEIEKGKICFIEIFPETNISRAIQIKLLDTNYEIESIKDKLGFINSGDLIKWIELIFK